MYNPATFKRTDPKLLLEVIEAYPLGTLITTINHQINTSYIPFLGEMNGNQISLLGHMARANPHWQELESSSTALICFRGPDRYISPLRYANPLNVPTWNYAVVEARGEMEIITDPNQVEEILQKSVTAFEKRDSSNWRYEIPENFRQELLKGIVGLRMNVTQIEGKLKLGSNRVPQDYEALLASLEKSPFDSDQAMVRWMKK